MADKAWKREERIVAKRFGAKRKLQKGTDEKRDVDIEKFCIDVKLRRKWHIASWFKDLQKYLKDNNSDEIPIMTIRKPGTRQRFAVLDLNDLVNILQKAEMIE